MVICVYVSTLNSDNYLIQTSSTASNSSLKRIRQHKTMRYISSYVITDTIELVRDMENSTYNVNSAKSDKDAKSDKEAQSKSKKDKPKKSKTKATTKATKCSVQATLSISGRMWLDLNNNGIIDSGEHGISNRTVELLYAGETSSSITEANTDSNGDYTFEVPTVGSYKIRFSFIGDESQSCAASYRGPENSINEDSGQCSSKYDTNVVEVTEDTTEIINISGGFVCDACLGSWKTVVNNAVPIPDVQGFHGKNFSSYNAPSVNKGGFVVFRARSTGGDNPSTGIFVRDMLDSSGSIIRQAGRRTTVPQPNNLNTTFIEFPSFPRLAQTAYYIAARGNHDPVLEYKLEGAAAAVGVGDDDEEETTRAGNTGLYFNLVAKDDTISTTLDDTSPNFLTGMAKLGNVPGYEVYQVPGLDLEYDGTVFDVFPGSPAIQDDGTIAFKGNYAIGNISQTGVFHRKLVQEEGGGDSQIYVAANSQTTIPDPIDACQTATFGSTSPPSIANSKLVFLGLDIEEDPKCGGLYAVDVVPSHYAPLKTIVNFETFVPGEEGGTTFTRFGEGISFDGSAVAFWGSWGDEFETISLCCPVYGNKDRRNYCLYNDTNTVRDNQTAPAGCTSGRYQNKTIPVSQGIFVYNEEDSSLSAIAKGNTKNGMNFVFWSYSGKPPEAGPTDDHGHRRTEESTETETEAAEPPRWRSSSSLALAQYNSIAYKMKDQDDVGIYHWSGGEVDSGNVIVQTGQNCTKVDDGGVDSNLLMESMALERDSFRGSRLVVSVACSLPVTDDDGDDDDHIDEDDEGDWGGIYMTCICPPNDPVG